MNFAWDLVVGAVNFFAKKSFIFFAVKSDSVAVHIAMAAILALVILFLILDDDPFAHFRQIFIDVVVRLEKKSEKKRRGAHSRKMSDNYNNVLTIMSFERRPESVVLSSRRTL